MSTLLATRLKSKRLELGLSQKELAEDTSYIYMH